MCKIEQGFYPWPAVEPGDPDDLEPYPLYQRSYPDKPGYISPRCLRCYDKADRARLRKLARTG